MMRIIVDAMGGDHAPDEIVRGALDAADVYKDVRITLVGDRDAIEHAAGKCGHTLHAVDVVHTASVIRMEDDPMLIMREKRDSSMAIGLQLLRDGADAFVSAGSTGALHVGSSLIVKRIKGVSRSAIATILPFKRPLLLLDSGANPSVTADYLEQWAVMGSIYMNKLFGIAAPEVGLLNNGTEECKGTPVVAETYQRLKVNPHVHFHGNVESKELPFGVCDVVVTDGFTGNITLKLVEGMGKFMFSKLKEMYMRNTATKMSFLVMKEPLKSMKKEFDASEYGGAPLLGLTKPVIKAHGSSDAKAIYNAIRQAIGIVECGIAADIAAKIQAQKAPTGENA